MAYTDNAAASVVNPAGLHGVKEFAVTGVIAPLMPTSRVPFSDHVATRAERAVVPLFFAGGAFRIHERVVTGAAVYAASGAGAKFARIPSLDNMPMNLTVAVLEAALPVAVEVTDELAVGAALRAAHAVVVMDVPMVVAEAWDPVRLETTMSGTGLPAGLLGIQYEPEAFLSLGFSYRTRLDVEMGGDGDVTGELFGGRQGVTVDSSWATAHSFRAGASASFDDLTLALDLSYTLLDDAVDDLPLELEFDDGTRIESEVTLNWKNSLGGYFGAQYLVERVVPVRAGFALMQSGTPLAYADPRMPPPGLMKIFSLGTGFHVASLDVDVGGAYAFAGDDVEQTPNGGAGRYEGDYFLVSTSLSYRH